MRRMRATRFIPLMFFGAMVLFGLENEAPSNAADAKSDAAAPAASGEYKLRVPFGLDEGSLVIPDDNPLTKEKVELGRLLFFDKRLSKDNTIACASCHLAKFAFKPESAGKRAGAARRPRSTGRSARLSSGTAGPRPWKSSPSGRSPIPSNTASRTTTR